eukprot:5176350-Prorocentrum_lima.AAC.1
MCCLAAVHQGGQQLVQLMCSRAASASPAAAIAQRCPAAELAALHLVDALPCWCQLADALP